MLSIGKKIICDSDNIKSIREKHPFGLHFVVGDTHGEAESVIRLMEKIQFDPKKDTVFFLGDYNGGGNPQLLLSYLAKYYEEQNDSIGFHLIRGNHERELFPLFPLENLPDIYVIKGKKLTFYLAHAGMVRDVFDLITKDVSKPENEQVFAYRLDDNCAGYNAPYRQIIWSRRGLYSQRSHWHNWPEEESLRNQGACIIHGHTPYCFFSGEHTLPYGDRNLFWEKQHIWFSEDLQSFDIDSNIKGRFENGEYYRGVTCLCLEVFDEIAEQNGGSLSIEGIEKSENGVFYSEYTPNIFREYDDISKILNAEVQMKTISVDINGNGVIR